MLRQSPTLTVRWSPAAGDQASWRYLEFFTANINNDHTRRAYPNVPYFVGSRISDPPPPLSDNVLHATDVSVLTIDGIKLIRVRLRLFASSGAGRNGLPLYEVIVGAPIRKQQDPARASVVS
jgi:hypothetical protein